MNPSRVLLGVLCAYALAACSGRVVGNDGATDSDATPSVDGVVDASDVTSTDVGQNDGRADTLSRDGSDVTNDTLLADIANDTQGVDSACGDGQSNCNGGCIDTTSDPSNCGGCGVVCCGGWCFGGVCGAEGPAGTIVCSSHSTTCTGPVAVNSASDPNNCGACGFVCASGASCVAGMCFGMDGGADATDAADATCPGLDVSQPIESGTCTGGTLLCGSRCVDVNSDPNNCGACGMVCAAGSVCLFGSCVCGCSAGLVRCGGTCGECICVDVQSDPNNCGGCGIVCPGANPTCIGGVCGGLDAACPSPDAIAPTEAGTCPMETVVCAGQCFDLRTDPNHCGSCDNVCPINTPCVNGSCGCECQAGFSSCTPIPCGGCTCVDLQSDPANCGACGITCGSEQSCVNGECRCACASPNTVCNGVCVLTDSDPANCGGCGVACAAGSSCVSGSCTTGCASGRTDCSGACVDTANDAMNCGGCGVGCPTGFVCALGVCC